MDSKCVSRKTLGRGARLCDLYDLRQDIFCDVSLLSCSAPEAAIDSLDVQDTFIAYTNEQTYHEKFQKLNIEADLKLSVLGGLFSLSGSGRYLNDESNSEKIVRGTLMYTITTKEDRINLLDNAIRPHVIKTHFSRSEATHVVSKIRYGANVFVTFEKKVHKYSQSKTIEGELRLTLEELVKVLASSGSGSDSGNFSDEAKREFSSFSIKVQGDVVLESVPQSIEDVLKLMSKIPQIVSKFNEGKGKAVEIALYPIKLLAEHYEMAILVEKLKNDIDLATIMMVESEIDNIVHHKQILNDFVADITGDFSEHVTQKERAECTEYQQQVSIADEKFREDLKEAILNIRQNGHETSIIKNAVERYRSNRHGAHNIHVFMSEKMALKVKMSFFQLMKGKDIGFLPETESVQNFVTQHNNRDVYILYYSDLLQNTEKEIWQSTYLVFLEIRKSNAPLETVDGVASIMHRAHLTSPKFLVVDLELHPREGGSNTGIHIVQYANGRVVTTDLVKDKFTAVTHNIILWDSIDQFGHVPRKSAGTLLICPSAIQSKCKAERRLWVCHRCNQTMQYDLKDHFYCDCGGTLLEDCQFKCCDPNHGAHFTSFVSVKTLKELLPKVADSDPINILLLGQTGVGKTTWINALRNYVEYPTFQDARAGGIKVLIPSKFKCRGTTVQVGEANSQEANTQPGGIGQSSTQSCTSHSFRMDGHRIQIIDTPGIGDVRGLKFDNENTEHILKYLEREDKLNGICILLKPDECRLTPAFQFSLATLLNNLHKNAANNIMFCYTHSEITDFCHGNTDGLVETMLGYIKNRHGQEIPYNVDNTFFFDSDSFRTLACIEKRLSIPKRVIDTCPFIWEKSVEATCHLLDTIRGIEPHLSVETISLNEARKLISQSSRPLAEVTGLITSNIEKRASQLEQITNETNTEINRLDACLWRDVEILELTPISSPSTVCTAKSCVSVVDTKAEYKVCHTSCHIPEILGHWGVGWCSCIDWKGNCKTCTCSWISHQHVKYKTKRVKDKRKDDEVQKLIDEKLENANILRSTKAKINDEIKELKGEQEVIKTACVRSAVFLKENALTPFNDCIHQWLERMIEESRMVGDTVTVESLEDYRKEYRKAKELYKESLAAQSSSGSIIQGRLRPEDVRPMIAELWKLPHSGTLLREQMELSEQCMERFKKYDMHSTSTIGKVPLRIFRGLAAVWGMVGNKAIMIQGILEAKRRGLGI